jgi:hypothetical protein
MHQCEISCSRWRKSRAQRRCGYTALRISRKIDRFVVAFNQTGIKIIGKTAVKNLNQLFVFMRTVH